MVDVVLELTRITQAVSMVSSPVQQVSVIVDEISRCLDVEVCSLYRSDRRGNMVLLASHGLAAGRPVKIPHKQGLVGLVVKSRHTINLSNGLKHPDYYHVQDIKEERFKSFCGAPLVCNGEVIGVLVVQGARARKLPEKQEAFVTTMASHIALIVKQLPASLTRASSRSILEGLSASDGVAVGSPEFCVKAMLDDVSLSKHRNVDAEIHRWLQLLQQVLGELNRDKIALGDNVSKDIASMFEAYKLLLLDQALSDRVIEGIRQGFALPSSLKHAIQHFEEVFRKMDDAYLRARAEDIWHIGNKLYQSYLGGAVIDQARSDTTTTTTTTASAERDLILIGKDISVSDIAAYPLSHLKGIACAGGSRLSHTAILANALGIPAVMGIDNLLSNEFGPQVIVDGSLGRVYSAPSDTILGEYQNLVYRQQAFEKELESFRQQEAMTCDGVRIQLLANSGLIADLSPGITHGAEGIGLFRTEIPFIVSDTFPTEEEQVEIYRNVLSHYPGKPVYMRTLDVGGDKQLPYFPILGEENPAMGWRGIRFTLDNIQLLITQLRAMLRAAGQSADLKIIVPMVSSESELVAFHKALSDAIEQLQEEKVSVRMPEVGIMLEVPAAISQLRFWAKHIDFVSLGTNDLSQYLLALDRNNPRVASRFDLVHPAVIAEINRAVQEARRLQLPLCVCGEMASHPVAVVLLIAMGVTRLSVSSARIPRLKALIQKLDMATIQVFLASALETDNAGKIRLEGEALLARL